MPAKKIKNPWPRQAKRGGQKSKVKSEKMVYVVVGILTLILLLSLFDFKISPNKNLLSVVGRFNPTPTPTPEPTAEVLSAKVVPEKGYKVSVNWGDIGKKLIEAGGIDMDKYRENYSGDEYKELMSYLTDNKNGGITINNKNAYFWVNTLWALGLTQKSDVLDKGIMGVEYKDNIGNFASTGGWTLGAKDAVSLYSSSEIIPLTADQQARVHEISKNIYRPCCGNPTSFPDCNHGMAILGLIEIMVSQGFSDNEIYDAALAFNSYWFTSTYVDLAYYFQTQKGTSWENIDAKKVLSVEFSSAPGYQTIKEKIGDIPGAPSRGGSCGA